MTENLAGRGEGLAGLVAKWRVAAESNRIDQRFGNKAAKPAAILLKKCADELETALEAAAPPGTAGICPICYHPNAALATPSLQASIKSVGAEKYERTHSRVWINAWNAAIEECAKHLREGWSVANKDNGDDVMEVLMEELGGLMLPTPSIAGGSSSVPVGEQKQEEGVESKP